MSPAVPGLPAEGEMEGRGLLVVDLWGTVALLVATVANAFSQATAVQVASLVVAGVLFLGGCVAFTIGFLRAVGRSREEDIALAGLFYLTGSAPDEVRRPFLGLWFAQMAIAVGAIAVARPPFGVMAPVWGIGMITWWASRHATFPPRATTPRGSGGGSASRPAPPG
ncbi:MAG: hypothetical protein U0P45_07345 [Acidimicrobiales bacterium]